MLETILHVLIMIRKEIQFKQFLWRISFLSLGFCKICFSMVSGLSAFAERSSKEIALVYTGPDDSDMLVSAIVLGLLAPAIAFSIASGAGIGALNTLAGQGFGLNTGVSGTASRFNAKGV
jgi:hypothetical protein